MNDDELVVFLHNHCPPPPEEKKPCEDLIMRAIALDSGTISQKKRRWLIPTTIMTTLVLLSGYMLKPRLLPQTAVNQENLENFMVNSWGKYMTSEDEENYDYAFDLNF